MVNADERRWLIGLGAAAAVVGGLIALAGVAFALAILLDPGVRFDSGSDWSWSATISRQIGTTLFEQNLPMKAIPAAPPDLATRVALAIVALTEAAVPAAIAFCAARAAQLSVARGFGPRLPRLAWITAAIVVAGVVVSALAQLWASSSVSEVFGIHDPLRLGWMFDAISGSVLLLLAIGGILLQQSARLQRDAAGLV